MARLTANVVLPGENGEVVTLLSGTEAPKWALPFLGAHVLDDETEQAATPDGSDVETAGNDGNETDDETEQAATPAKPRRR